jgi:hypothetical protein
MAAFEGLRLDAIKNAKVVIYEKMPLKLNELDQLHQKFSYKSSESESEVGVHTAVIELLVILRSEIATLLESIEIIKFWIKLNIPKVEGGNNFGVSIQEDMIGILNGGTKSGRSYLGSMTKYYVRRAELLRDIEKYPGVEDLHLSLQEMDQKEFAMLTHCCLETRNNYAILLDVLTKNMDRLENPKNDANAYRDFFQ